VIGPTSAELTAAFHSGAEVRVGRVTVVECAGGRTLVADLAHPGQWVAHSFPLPKCSMVETSTSLSAMVDGMLVEDADAATFASVLRILAGVDRHGPDGDKARMAAGAATLRIVNAMVRARLLDAVDGWAAVCGDVVDGTEGGPDGTLFEVRPGVVEVSARVICVICPSTRRKYAHLVPIDQPSAASARRWLMSLDPDAIIDVET